MSGHAYRRQSKKERVAASAQRVVSRLRKVGKARSSEGAAPKRKKPS